MARKISREEAEPAPAPQGAEAGADEHARQAAEQIAILHPDGGITLDGRTVVVREYGHIEGLSLRPAIKQFVAALYDLHPKTGAPPAAIEILDVMAVHAVTVQWLVAQSITPYPENSDDLPQFAAQVAENAKWVATLGDIQGDALLGLWWSTVRGFFIRRFRVLQLAELEQATRSSQPASTQT